MKINFTAALLVLSLASCKQKESGAPTSATDIPTPAQASTPTPAPQAPVDPVVAVKKANLQGQLFHSGDHFAIFRWEPAQVSFFSISSGTSLSMEDRKGATSVFDRNSYVSSQQYSLCPLNDISVSSECTKPLYPEPEKAIRSEVLQVQSRPGITNDSKYILVSTERYRADKNTAFNPVANPFYAIFDLAGNEVYRLPNIEHSSGTYVFAMGMDPDEPAALFGIGGTMDVCNAENDYDMPALVKEVLLWTPPNNLKRIDTRKRTPEVEALMKRFNVRDMWFDFYQWPSKEARHGC